VDCADAGQDGADSPETASVGDSIVSPQAGYEPGSPQFFDAQIRMPQWQRHEGGIDRSRQNFFRQMRRVSMRRPHRADGKDLFM
jgi:hypothetical protein